MDSKLKVELLKLSLAMRKARQYEKKQEALKKNEGPAKKKPEALAIPAQKFLEEENRKRQQ